TAGLRLQGQPGTDKRRLSHPRAHLHSKGQAPERADRVRGRVRGVTVAVGTGDAGTQRPQTRAAPSLQLEAAVAGRRIGVRTGWQRCAPGLRAASWRLQTLIDFLCDMRQLEQRRSVLLLWDGLPSHRDRRMTDWDRQPTRMALGLNTCPPTRQS